VSRLRLVLERRLGKMPTHFAGAAPLRWQRQGPVDSAELPDGRHISALPR